ncbi:MAG: LamG domain-containing protein [Akkermansiaceae bacterium]|nr:LamG domain-containing protein [Verrucomicrobiales bacterium]
MMRKPLITNIGVLPLTGLVAFWAGSALAQPAGQTNYTWSAGGDKMTWSQPANWTGGLVPPTDEGSANTWAVFVETGYPASSKLPVTIAATDAVKLNDAFFGPTWGETLNIRGTVRVGFGWFIFGDAFAGVSTVNMFTNSAFNANDTIAHGVAWWFPGGANAVINMYDNAQIGVTWFQFGAVLNLYGGTVSVTNGWNTGSSMGPVFPGGFDTDVTRLINMINGQLILPGSYTPTINNWITRGIFTAYGKKFVSDDILIDEAHPDFPGRTVVTLTPLGGALVSTRLSPRTNMMAGTVQQVDLLGNFPGVTNAVLRAFEPATLPGTLAYQSSAANVFTVTTNGLLTAVNPGTATLTVTMGSFSNSVAITVTPYNYSLIHRYSFTESSGTTAADSVGGPTWNGTLNGFGASLSGGQLLLDGSDGYVQLPAGVVSNLAAITVETWASFGETLNAFGALYAFGDTDENTGLGRDYIALQPFTVTTNIQATISDSNPGNVHEQSAFAAVDMQARTNIHIVAVYHPYAGFIAIYTNGVQVAINNNVNIPLAAALDADPLNYIGRSLYSADPYLLAAIDEFRIYRGALRASEVRAAFLLGPNQPLGMNQTVSLTATLIGGNLVLSWPVSSALVNLTSSAVIGPGAVWTSVTGTLIIEGGNYKMTLPATDSARFYRLQN